MMNDTETILALEDALVELRRIKAAMPYTGNTCLLDNICMDLDQLTDDMREASMKAGPPVHHAIPTGAGHDANGSPC